MVPQPVSEPPERGGDLLAATPQRHCLQRETHTDPHFFSFTFSLVLAFEHAPLSGMVFMRFSYLKKIFFETGPHYVVQTALELRVPPASAS